MKIVANDDKSFLTIDLDNLEDEWCIQPKLLHKWATKLAKAKRDLDFLKTEIEVYEADMTLKVRRDPGAYEFKKPPSEKTLESFVKTRKGHQKLRASITEAQYAVNLLQATVNTLDTRKKALENAVDLFGMDYFAAPRAKKNGAEAVKRMEQRRART